MPVISINIGPKRVHLTAYCPEVELRRWLISARPVSAPGDMVYVSLPATY